MPTFALDAYRVAPRKPWLRVGDATVTLRVPTWFGGRTFSTPVANVAVADLDHVEEHPREDVPLYEPPAIPYVYATGALSEPNVCLAFREAVRLPRFRLLVRGQVSEMGTRWPARDGRPAGRYVDGMLLRAADPQAVVAALAAAGAERVSDPYAWLVARRPAVTDPVELAEIERRERRGVALDRACTAVVAAGAVAFGAGRLWLGEGVELAGGATVFAGLVAGSAAMWWRQRRAYARRRGVPRVPEAER